jgi:hypothetical protein
MQPGAPTDLELIRSATAAPSGGTKQFSGVGAKDDDEPEDRDGPNVRCSGWFGVYSCFNNLS